MDLSLAEPVLRLIITLEFAAMALVGLAVTATCISLDAEIRTLTRIHSEILSGIYDSVQAQITEKETKRQGRLDAIHSEL